MLKLSPMSKTYLLYPWLLPIFLSAPWQLQPSFCIIIITTCLSQLSNLWEFCHVIKCGPLFGKQWKGPFHLFTIFSKSWQTINTKFLHIGVRLHCMAPHIVKTIKLNLICYAFSPWNVLISKFRCSSKKSQSIQRRREELGIDIKNVLRIENFV